MCGLQILNGPLYAEEGSRTDDLFLLSGAYLPKGADLSLLHARVLHAQGIRAANFRLGSVYEETLLDFALVEGLLDLTFYTGPRNLSLLDARIGKLCFGPAGAQYARLDLRGTSIDEVDGDFPGTIYEVLSDERTKTPEEFRDYLEI